MFRKKQTPTKQGRNVRQQPAANVFSYYASRSSGDGQSRQPPPVKRKAPNLRASQWMSYLPSLVAGIALLLCMIYVSTLSDNPKLQVVGNPPQAQGLFTGVKGYEADVRAVFSESLSNRSKLLINTDQLAKKLQERFPELGDIAIVLPLVGRRPVVQIRPAEPALVLGTLQGALVIDEHGRTIADAGDVESSILDKLPTLQDESSLSLERGSYALPKETVSFVMTVAAQLQEKKLEIQSIVLPAVANEMHIRLRNRPYYIKFNLRGDGRIQAGTLIATKGRLEADHITPRHYIDVRVPGKVFYK